MTSKAHGPAIIDDEHSDQLSQILDARAGTQAGKPRSRNPKPLGVRIFDMNCRWPMYRIPYRDSFCYKCGLYMQSQPHQCPHNWVDGPMAINANASQQSGRHEKALATRKKELANVRQQVANAKRNAALAESRELFQEISGIYEELKAREAQLTLEIAKSETSSQSSDAMKQAIESAIESVKQFPTQAEDPDNLGAIGELFHSANLQMFLKFHRVQIKNRVLNKLDLGILTMGDAPLPIKKYDGPTGRDALKGKLPADNNHTESDPLSKVKTKSVPGKKAKSLGKDHHAGA